MSLTVFSRRRIAIRPDRFTVRDVLATLALGDHPDKT